MATLTSIREEVVRAEIRGLHSPDVEDLASFRPKAAGFSVLIQLLVGPVGGDGEESFELVVCSPGWLADQVAHVGPIAGAHHLVVNDWDWHAIAEVCARRVAAVEGPSWRTVAQSLNQFAAWEFDGYDD